MKLGILKAKGMSGSVKKKNYEISKKETEKMPYSFSEYSSGMSDATHAIMSL